MKRHVGYRAALFCALAVLLLAGCYPELDWRELRSVDGGFVVMFPDRPKEITRDIVLGGAALRMHMLTTEGHGTAFGVGYADLPADVAANVLIGGARDALVHNVAGRVDSERPVNVGGLEGLEFYAEGAAGDDPMVVAARVLADDRRLYQVLFVGKRERAQNIDLAFYLGSFKPLPR